MGLGIGLGSGLGELGLGKMGLGEMGQNQVILFTLIAERVKTTADKCVDAQFNHYHLASFRLCCPDQEVRNWSALALMVNIPCRSWNIKINGK